MTDRRNFFKTLAGLTAGITLTGTAFGKQTDSDRLGEVLPKRKLDRTGE